MGNPALELHALYASWKEAIAESPSNKMRAHLKLDSPEGVATLRRAYSLLAAIDETLRNFELAGRRTNPFRKQLDGWSLVPLSLQAGWSSSVAPEHLVSDGMLDQIEGLGAYLEGKVLVLSADQHDLLRLTIDQADGLLTAQDFDPVLAHYLRRLIAAIRYALDDEAAGRAFDFERAVQELWVAFNAAAERAPESQKSSWRDLAQQIAIGVVSGGAVEAGIITIKAITGQA